MASGSHGPFRHTAAYVVNRTTTRQGTMFRSLLILSALLLLALLIVVPAAAQPGGGEVDRGDLDTKEQEGLRRERRSRPSTPPPRNETPPPQRLYIHYQAFCKVKFAHTKYKYNVWVTSDPEGRHPFVVDNIKLEMDSGFGFFTRSWSNRHSKKFRDFHYGTMSCNKPSIYVTITHHGKSWRAGNTARRTSPAMAGMVRSHFTYHSIRMDNGNVVFRYKRPDVNGAEAGDMSQQALSSLCQSTGNTLVLDLETDRPDTRVNCYPLISRISIEPAPLRRSPLRLPWEDLPEPTSSPSIAEYSSEPR